MGGIGTLLASDPTVQAMANLGGLVGLAILTWAALKRGVLFAKSVHQNSIKGALRIAKFRRVRRTKWLALDIHLLALSITSRFMVMMVLLLVMGVSVTAGHTPAQEPLIHVTPHARSIMHIIFDVIYPLASSAIFAGVSFETVYMMHLVRRHRWKIIRSIQMRYREDERARAMVV